MIPSAAQLLGRIPWYQFPSIGHDWQLQKSTQIIIYKINKILLPGCEFIFNNDNYQIITKLILKLTIVSLLTKERLN